jgi:hypothetical protein
MYISHSVPLIRDTRERKTTYGQAKKKEEQPSKKKEERYRLKNSKQEITMGETRNCIWYLGHWKQNTKGCLIQGNKNARLMGNNYPPSLP